MFHGQPCLYHNEAAEKLQGESTRGHDDKKKKRPRQEGGTAEAEAHRGSCQEELKVRLIEISTAAGKSLGRGGTLKRKSPRVGLGLTVPLF